MRRPFVAALVLILLVLVAAAAGLLASGRIGDERLRATAERALGEALGGEVWVARAELRLAAGGPTITASGLRAFGDDDPALTVRRASARLDTLSLMLGEVRLRSVHLERAQLRVRREADGKLGPPPIADLLERGPPAALAGDDAVSFLKRLERTARGIVRSPLPFLRARLAPQRIELRSARVEIVDGESGETISLDDIDGHFLHGGRGDARVAASARLVDEAGEAGWVTLEAHQERGVGPRLALRGRHLDLSVLAPWFAALHPDMALAGVADGSVTLELTEDAAKRVAFDLQATRPRLSLPRTSGRPPLRLAGESARAKAVFEVTPKRVHLMAADLDLDGTHFEADGVMERPIRRDARAHLSVRVRSMEIEDARDATGLLPDPFQDRIAATLARVEGGRVARLELDGTATLEEWGIALDPEISGMPVDLRGTAHLSDVAIDLGEGERLEGLSGRVSVGRDRVEIHDGGSDLELVIDGLETLLTRGERDLEARPPPPGLASFVEMVRDWTRKKPDSVERPGPPLGPGTVQLDWLSHPATAFPLRDTAIDLRPDPKGGLLLEASGDWGGLPMRAEGRVWRGEPGGRGGVKLHIEVDPPRPDAPRKRERPPGFLSAGFVFDTARVRGVPVEDLIGELRGEGASLLLERATARVKDGGEADLVGHFDLSREGVIPSHLTLQTRAGELASLSPAFKLELGDLVGPLDGTARVSGELRPYVSVFSVLEGGLRIHARDGEIRRRPALSGALADSDDQFKGLDSAESLPFVSAVGDFSLLGGRLYTDSLVIEGKRVRIVVSGSVRLDGRPHDVQAVMAFFPHNPVDAIVGRVPIIGAILKGPDGKIIGRYMEVTGPWESPRVARIKGRNLATGMLEGVPHFVMDGLRAIGGVLARLNPIPQGMPSEGS